MAPLVETSNMLKSHGFVESIQQAPSLLNRLVVPSRGTHHNNKGGDVL